MKTIIFLGSSVTYGAASGGVSFADVICRNYGFNMIKEAVSGTTLVDEGPDSYIARLKTIDADPVDLFICQLSTNDATLKKPLGSICAQQDAQTYDTKTVAGAIEYIITYAKEKWGCPVLFYTNPRYDSKEYADMVTLLKEIAAVHAIGIIDLWNDESFNETGRQNYARFMADPIHPTLDGYTEWFAPYFEETIDRII